MQEFKPLVIKDGNISQLPDGDYISGDISDVPQREEIDFDGDDVIYKGWAAPGSLDSASVWKIQKISFVGVDQDVSKQWYDSGNYTGIWDDRTIYSYS